MADNNKPTSASTNADEVAEEIRAQLKAMQKSISQQMRRALTTLEAEIVQNVRSKSGLHVRTGALLNSIGGSKKVTVNSDGSVTGQIGSVGIPYAAIHEFGGTVKAVNKQYLAIPTEENRRNDGSPIVTTDALRAMQKLGLSFIDKGVIFQKTSKEDQTPIAMFILKKSVDIPARPYLRPALAAKQDQILKDFGIFLAAAFEPKGGTQS